MSRWTAIAIAGIWMGIGIASFNVDPESIKTIALFGAIVSGAIGFFDVIK